MDIETTQRRRSARRPGLWHGRYRARRLRRWTDCPLRDVSLDGAAIEVEPGHAVPRDRLQLELRPVGSAMTSLTVWATVRNVRARADGGTLVGLEFIDLAPSERSALDRMIRIFAT